VLRGLHNFAGGKDEEHVGYVPEGKLMSGSGVVAICFKIVHYFASDFCELCGSDCLYCIFCRILHIDCVGIKVPYVDTSTCFC
jgi:hypothetical protein